MDDTRFEQIVGAHENKIFHGKHTKRDYQKYVVSEHLGRKVLQEVKSHLFVFKSSDFHDFVLELHKDGHQKALKLWKCLKEKHFILCSEDSVRKIIKNCRSCIKLSKQTKSSHRKIEPLKVEKEPLSRVQIDLKFWGSLEDPGGYKYMMVIVDCFSKYAWTFALINKTPDEVRQYLESWLSTYGDPGKLHTDNGMEFTSGEMAELATFLSAQGVEIVQGRPRNPGSQGEVQSVNKALIKLVLGLLEENHLPWSHVLQRATDKYNEQYNTSITSTPFDVFFGFKKRMGKLKRHLIPGEITAEDREVHAQKRRRIRADAERSLHKARDVMIGRNEGSFEVLAVGDVVTQEVPVKDQLTLEYPKSVFAKVQEMKKTNCYKLMYRDGSLSAVSAHVSTLVKQDDEVWEDGWAELEDAKKKTTKIAAAARLYM